MLIIFFSNLLVYSSDFDETQINDMRATGYNTADIEYLHKYAN